jgi:hypothetical protein
MQDEGAAEEVHARPMMAGFRERSLASLGAMLGMLALPILYQLSTSYGPAARVVFYAYVPADGLGHVLLAALVGASLGAEAYRPFLPRGRSYSAARVAAGCMLGLAAGAAAGVVLGLLVVPKPFALGAILICSMVGCWYGGFALHQPREADPRGRRIPWVRLAGLALLVAWSLLPHFRAFPAHGTLTERDRWARKNVREYAGLVRIVHDIPAVTQDVGRIIDVAPTSRDQHRFGREMNGDDMRFTLEVVGDKGAGTLWADCTLSSGRVMSWTSGRWTFHGQTTPINVVPGTTAP